MTAVNVATPTRVRWTCRGVDGVHDIELRPDGWRCSCGRPDSCHHVGAAVAHLIDAAASAVKPAVSEPQPEREMEQT